MILTQSAPEAEELRSKLSGPAQFFELARRYSKDASAPSGGFLGAMWLDRMEPYLAEAAARLDYGEVSPVVQTPAGHVLLQRLPRDFRWQANALFGEATELKRKGQLQAAMEKNQRALETYPIFLRALLFLGISLGEGGDMGRSVGVLEFAERQYPQDAGVQLNLGIAYGATGQTGMEIAAYRRALDVEPDLIPAYLNLGAAHLAAGRVEKAAETYRAGLQVNPLSAALYYNLSLVYTQQGKTAEAGKMSVIAAKIEPRAGKK